MNKQEILEKAVTDRKTARGEGSGDMEYCRKEAKK